MQETEFFRLAVAEVGVGAWHEIREAQPLLQRRSEVDLKDKWRNMNKNKTKGPMLKQSNKTNMPIDV